VVTSLAVRVASVLVSAGFKPYSTGLLGGSKGGFEVSPGELSRPGRETAVVSGHLPARHLGEDITEDLARHSELLRGYVAALRAAGLPAREISAMVYVGED
jgi:hypothetical protein